MVTAEVVDPLLAVLRKHGVSRFRTGPGGSFEVEFHAGEARTGLVGGANDGAPPDASAPPPPSGDRPLFEGIPSDDPLFDHVRKSE